MPDVVTLPGSGTRLAVRRTQPAGRPWALALLVHGLASNARMWDACAEALAAAGVAAVAVDQREHGASAGLGPVGSVDTGTAAADVSALVGLLADEPALGGLPVLLAGQSWGGNVVLQCAADAPGSDGRGARVDALALVDGGWLRFPDDEPFERLWERLAPPSWGATTWEQLVARVAPAVEAWGPHALEAVLGNLTTDEHGHVRNVLPRASHERILRSMHEQDPRRLYPRVRVPVLLAPAGGPAAALVDEAVAGLPHPVLRPYPDSHHDLHLQHPERLAGDLVDVLVLATSSTGTQPQEEQP